MKKFLALLVVAIGCMLGNSVAQTPGTTWSTSQVTLVSPQVGNGANFYLNTHGIGQDICIEFTLDPISRNVFGNPAVAGRYTVLASQVGDIYVGRYQQINSAYAWNVYITFSYVGGRCN